LIRRCWLSKSAIQWKMTQNCLKRSSKVINYVTNGKPMYDFLSMNNSNYAPISQFSEIRRCICWKSPNLLTCFGFTAPLGAANDTGVILVWLCTWGLSTLSMCQVLFPYTGWFLLYACWCQRTRTRWWWWWNDLCHPCMLSTAVLSDNKDCTYIHLWSEILWHISGSFGEI